MFDIQTEAMQSLLPLKVSLDGVPGPATKAQWNDRLPDRGAW